MIQEFIVWVDFFISKNKKSNFSFYFSIGAESSNQGAYLDIENHIFISRITFWDDGQYHIEIIDIESEKIMYEKIGIVEQFSQIFNQELSYFSFFSFLGLSQEKYDNSI